MTWTVAGIVVLAGSSCERKELEFVCTPVAPGQIVVSELRGPQTGVDTWGQWIELYNTSGDTINVAGLRLRLTQLDGTGEHNLVIRDHDAEIGPTGYFVLGRFDPDSLPDHVDYGYTSDYTGDLYEDGILEVYVCNELIDTVIYRHLPAQGTLAFDGGQTLTDVANDIESNWCVDASEVANPTEVGIPGTPGEQNRPCEP